MAIDYKIRRATILILSLILISGLVGIVTMAYLRQDKPRSMHPQTGVYPRSSPRHAMSGFTYTGTHEGRKVIWFHAEKLLIEKQKVGFLKFNLLNRVRFDNASIKIYGQPRRSGAVGEDGKTVMSGLTFENTFTRESMPSLPVKRISAIEFKPITVELYKGDQLLTRISANKAKARVRTRTISFEGGVQVESGNRRLVAERLSLTPDKEIVKIKGRYTLNAIGEQKEGYDLVTDLLLKSDHLEG